LKTSDFYYDLPPDAVAQEPVEPRDASRLLVLRQDPPVLEDRVFRDLPELLEPGDLLVVNDTRVLPWKLVGRRSTGGRVECLILELREGEGVGFFRPGGKLKPGEPVEMEGGSLVAWMGRPLGEGKWAFRLESPRGEELEVVLERVGRPPLPPYIKRDDQDPRLVRDKERYQTIFARSPGAVAAPTASLHFTPRVLRALKERGVETARVTLHVGAGTFRPVKVERLEDHKMHAESFHLPGETARAVAETRARGGKVVAAGTTVVRVLETRAKPGGLVEEGAGWTDLFLYPGKSFQVVDALVTNFHLPGSTLLMLVCAFAGKERVLAAYRHALEKGYRFYSYGDAMLLFSAGSSFITKKICRE